MVVRKILGKKEKRTAFSCCETSVSSVVASDEDVDPFERLLEFRSFLWASVIGGGGGGGGMIMGDCFKTGEENRLLEASIWCSRNED